MAKGKKLMLSLGLDLSSFDAAFAAADSTAKKRRDAINKSMSEIGKQFEIQINNAKLSGDAERALALDTERLTAKVELLRRAEENLAKVREATIKRGNDKEIAAVEAEYQNAIIRRQKMELILKNQKDRTGQNGVMNTFQSLSMNSRFGGVIATLANDMNTLNTLSKAVGATLTGTVAAGFGIAATAAMGYYQVLKSVTEASDEAAKKAAEIGENTYKMKERLSLDETTANRLSDLFSLDGTNADAVLKKVESLGAALLTASEDGTKAEQTLNRYGETLRNADGSMKNAEQALTAIANAYKKAEEAGLGYQVLAETGMGKFSTLIASWDGLIERAGGMTRAFGATTKAAHEYADATADLALRNKELTKAQGSEALASQIKVLQHRNKLLEEQIELENKLKPSMQAYEERIAYLTKKLDSLSSAWEMAKTKAKAFAGELIIKNGADREHIASAADRELEQKLEDERKKAQAKREQERIALEAKQKATAEANASLEKMTWEIKASDYDKELAKIDEIAEKKRKDGADEVKIAEYVAEAKAQATEKLNAKIEAQQKQQEQKQKQEHERILAEYKKQEQERINAEQRIQGVLQSSFQNRMQQIEREKQAWIKAGADEAQATIAAEKQKADARKSEAEKALTSQKKLWQAYLKFGDTEQFRQFALNDRLKSLGISKKEYATMNGTRLEGFMEAMNKFQNNTWFAQLNGQFGNTAGDMAKQGMANPTVNNNNVNNTITIDRPVLTDESLINQLVDRVSEKMVAVAEKAFGNRAQNTFG